MKRFKTSPFTWSNPLSGYSIVLVKIPPSTPGGQDRYQLQVVRSRNSPYAKMKASSPNMRPTYVLKWFDEKPY